MPPLGPHPVDLALLALLLETLGLLLWHRLGGRGPAPASVLPTLAAGAFLLLALRACLGGARESVLLLCLAAAFLAHLVDLRGRWPR